MVKIQPCRNGCGQLISVQDHEGKWKPFNVTEDGIIQGLHDCPNSDYHKKRQQGGGWTGTNKQGQMFEAKESQETDIKMALKILADVNRNVLEVLGLVRDQVIKNQTQKTEWKDFTDDEIKTVADTEQIDEPRQVPEKEDEYGF